MVGTYGAMNVEAVISNGDKEMKKTKDRPVNMPCSDPEGCKHFKAEMKLEERIKKLLINKNNIICMWCSKDIVSRKTVYGKLEIIGKLAQHLLSCPGHPLKRRINELIKERKQLRGKITRLENKLRKPCYVKK